MNEQYIQNELEKMNQLLHTPIGSLDVTLSLSQWLINHGIHNLAEVIAKKEEFFSNEVNPTFGARNKKDLDALLKEHNLTYLS